MLIDYPDFFKKSGVISINEPYQASPFTEQDCSHLLILNFHDMVSDRGAWKMGIEKAILFNEEMADQVLDFIDEIKDSDIEKLYIHCYQGISRSTAIGTFINNYLYWNKDDVNWIDFYKYNQNMSPNSLVLSKLVKQSKLRVNNE